MSAHTPGPWRAVMGSGYQWLIRGPSRNTNGAPARIAVLGSPRVYESSIGAEDEANARLISIAPDMYSMLVVLEESLEEGHWQNTKEVIRGLIAKATGGQ